jgi:DNA polymerase-3 subunit alpha
MNLRTINKRVLESLTYAGAFDELPPLADRGRAYRSCLLAPSEKHDSFLEHLLRYAHTYQEDKIQSANSLFGDLSDSVSIPPPPLPKANPWSLVTLLQRERDVIGIYLSGHPLDDYRFAWESFAIPIAQIEHFKDRKVALAGFVVKAEHRISQKGSGWGRIILQDYTGDIEISLFSENYLKFKSFLQENECLYIEGEYRQRTGSTTYELRVNNVRLLERIEEEKTKGITLRLPLERITPALIAQMEQICSAHKGKHALRIEVIDGQNQERLSFVSVNQTVQVSQQLLTALMDIGVEFNVN